MSTSYANHDGSHNHDILCSRIVMHENLTIAHPLKKSLTVSCLKGELNGDLIDQ